MSRLPKVLLSAIGFGSGFAFLYLAQFAFSPLSRSSWLVPALILAVTAVLGFLPSYRAIESRIPVFFGYGSAFGLLFVLSLPAPSPGSAADRISVAAVPLLMFSLALSLAAYWIAWRSHRSARWITLALALGLLVSYFSGTSGGTGGGAWARWLIDSLGLSPGLAEAFVIAVRKAIHFTFYGLLGWVSFRAARSEDFKLGEATVFAVTFSGIHACFDELRQTMTPDRTGSLIDLFIDLAGAFVFARLAVLSDRTSRPKRS